MIIRIAVLNMQSGIGATKGYRQYFTSGWKYLLPHSSKHLHAAGDLLREKEIDIALITEVEAKAMRSGFKDQTHMLKEKSAMQTSVFFPTRTIDPMVREGNAIVSRYRIISHKKHLLTAGMLPRVLGETVLDIEGRTITVFVAHLALRSAMRRTQIHEIAEIVRHVDGPVILGGDFNERKETTFEILRETGLKQFCGLPNFPSWNPKHALAVTFLSSHFEIVTQSVPQDVQFSDHLPLIVEARLTTHAALEQIF